MAQCCTRLLLTSAHCHHSSLHAIASFFVPPHIPPAPWHSSCSSCARHSIASTVKRNAMAERNRITDSRIVEPGGSLTHRPSGRRASVRREPIVAAAVAVVFAFPLCVGSVHAWAGQDDRQQMKGLDEQVQEIKSDVLNIA